MVPKKIILLWFLVSFFFMSCMNTVTKDESAHIATSTATLPVTQFVTATEASSLLSPTVFPTLPTLPPEGAYTLLLEMLNQNATCELPCWLDITPGVSTHPDAYLKWAGFLALLGTTKIEPRDFSYYFEYSENGEDFSTITTYFLQPTSDTIDSMYITTQTLRTLEDGSRPYAYDSIVYKSILNNYLLASVLMDYGQPDRVLLSMDITYLEEPSPDSFNIWLFYPSREAIINYEGEAIIKNNVIRVCPSNTFVTMWLGAPGGNNLYSETLDQEIWSPTSQYYKSTIEALGITQEEFYNEFKEANSECLESPIEIWPVP